MPSKIELIQEKDALGLMESLATCDRDTYAYTQRQRGQYSELLNLIDTAKDLKIDILHTNDLRRDILNGAENVRQWCFGGCGLVYSDEIAAAFASPSELETYERTGLIGCNDPMRFYAFIMRHVFAMFDSYALKVREMFDAYDLIKGLYTEAGKELKQC